MVDVIQSLINFSKFPCKCARIGFFNIFLAIQNVFYCLPMFVFAIRQNFTRSVFVKSMDKRQRSAVFYTTHLEDP